MRVITGSARGRRLKELEGMETRPTTDRVKEGLFNVLQFDIEGRRVLDLFAGTGQLGIECLSHLTDRARVVAGDSMEFLKSVREKFDLVLLDPPYQAELLEAAIAHIARHDLLTPHGMMAAEHPADKTLPALSAPYRMGRTYRYGKIAVTIYHRDGEAEA